MVCKSIICKSFPFSGNSIIAICTKTGEGGIIVILTTSLTEEDVYTIFLILSVLIIPFYWANPLVYL